MKNKLVWVIVFIFMAFNAILLYKFKKIQTENKKIQQSYWAIKQDNEHYKNIIGYFYQEEGKVIKNEICTAGDGRKINLHDVIRSKNQALIFRYSSLDCSDCVHSVLDQLSKTNHVRNLIVISDFNSIASMNFMKTKFNLQQAIFLKSTTDEDVLATPCVFLSNKEFKITKFLIINQGDKVLDNYLRIL